MAAKKPATKPSTKKPTKKQAVTLEALQEVALDFNSFMFDEGKGLKFEHLEYDDLLAELTEAAEDLVAEDVVTAETAATLKTLGIECPAGVSEAEEADEPEDVDVDDSEEVDDDQDEDPTDEQEEVDNSEAIALAEVTIPKVKKSKKLDELKALAKENGLVIPPPFLKDIVKMKEYLVKKLTAISDGEIPAKKSKAAKPKKEKKEKKPFVMDAIREIVCADETITPEELKKQITAQGFVVTDRTVFGVHTDTGKIISCLKANGRLKK